MNLLLLLSALLSALTGVMPSARRADVALAVTQAATTTRAARVLAVAVVSRPLQAPIGLADAATAPIVADRRTPGQAMLWTNRRRE